MDRLVKFDEGLKKINSYDSLLNNVLKYIYSVMGVFVLAVMVPEFWDFHLIYKLHIFLFPAVIPVCLLYPFLYIKSSGVRTSVFGIMREVPFDKDEFKKSRINCLLKYEAKFFIWCVVMRAIIIVFISGISVESIVKSIIVLVMAAVTMYISGIIYINHSMKC